MLAKLHGIVRGRLIELDEVTDLPDGTKVEVTIEDILYEDAWKRQKEMMVQGFYMGQWKRVKREELYERA